MPNCRVIVVAKIRTVGVWKRKTDNTVQAAWYAEWSRDSGREDTNRRILKIVSGLVRYSNQGLDDCSWGAIAWYKQIPWLMKATMASRFLLIGFRSVQFL